MLAQLNDCIGGLLHLGPNVITFRTLLHLGQLLHLGLQHRVCNWCNWLIRLTLLPNSWESVVLVPRILSNWNSQREAAMDLAETIKA